MTKKRCQEHDSDAAFQDEWLGFGASQSSGWKFRAFGLEGR